MEIAVIGCGGIGSFFAMYLNRAIQTEQLPMITNQNITLFDFDMVDNGNLMHQNFYSEEITVHKASVLSLRYMFNARVLRFEERHLSEFDYFVICADNKAARNIVYRHCIDTGKQFLDMRSEGLNIMIFTDREDPEVLIDSLGEDKDNETGFSCRTAQDREMGQVQMGNAVVAPMGMQVLLQQFRQEDYPACVQENILGDRNIFFNKGV